MSADISLEEVKRRAQVAGIAIREDRWEAVRRLLVEALRPLRAVDSREIATLEPAMKFDARGEAAHGR